MPQQPEQAVFLAPRNPQLFLNDGRGHRIQFRDGEYRTSDPVEIQFLLAIVADEAKSNRAVEVGSMPSATAVDALASGEVTHTRRSSRSKLAARTSRRVDPADLVLTRGPHQTAEEGLNILEAAAYLDGEPHSDHPESVSVALATFLRSIELWLENAERQRFAFLVPRLVDTAGSDLEEQSRAFAIADYAGRGVVLALLEHSGHADTLRRQAPVTDSATAYVTASVVRAIANTVSGTRVAALAAAGGVLAGAARLSDADRRAAQARAHARWATEQGREVESAATAARAVAEEAAQVLQAVMVEAEAARAAVTSTIGAADVARSELAVASAATLSDARAAAALAEDAWAQAETHAIKAAELVEIRTAEAQAATEHARAAEVVASTAVAARTSAERAARAEETAAARFAEVIVTQAAEVVAIAARVGERERIVDEMLQVVEHIAATKPATRSVAA